MPKHALAALIVCCFSSFALLAQQAQGPLTNQRIGDLVLAGVSPNEIERIISSAPAVNFDLRPGSTDNLLKVGASEDVIKAMAARESGAAAPAEGTSASMPRSAILGSALPAATPLSAQPLVGEVGAYYEQNGQWVEMMPEIVNWQTGGVLKNAATLGFIKHDVNDRLKNEKSTITLAGPVQLLVYSPEGTQITEYQLIRLRMHSNAREFRTVTGGILHVSGGSKRDDLPFSSQHVAVRTWSIPLNGLRPGEYGLLPPANESRSASAQLGKRYTFTII